jgi:DNA-binding protein Fis
MTTPEQKFQKLFEEMYDLCAENGWGDPFSYARSREIHMAGVLSHKVADTYSGADAIDDEGEVEYKSTINAKINATYNGISVQKDWEEQERYIVEDKVGKYTNHYFARYEGGKIAEIWKMSGDDVLSLLLPKIKKQFHSKRQKNAKDPRIGVTLTEKEIHQFAEKIK